MTKATQRQPKKHTSKRDGLRPARPTVEGYARAIIKDLGVIVACSGWRAHEVFEDWLELVYFTLQRAPEHIRAHAAHLPAPPDPPIIAQAFARARLRYGRHWQRVQTQFSHALALAQLAAQDGIIDVVGPVFEQWGYPNADKGQFFTPPDVSKLMVRLINEHTERSPGGTAILDAHLNAAADATPLAALGAFFGQAFRVTDASRARLLEAAATVLELDPLLARRLDVACARGVEALMILTLGELGGLQLEGCEQPDGGSRSLAQVVAGLLDAEDALGRSIGQLVALSPSAAILHLWAWALHVEGSERRGWLLEAIARRIAADGELRERLCAQITSSPDLYRIAPANWALDTLSPAERRWMFGEVAAPAAAAFQRVSCHDPALGAATLLVHMAEAYRAAGYGWAVDFGLVLFYGQEVDRRVFYMGSINTMLAGLNGYRMRCAIAHAEGQIIGLQRARAVLLGRLEMARQGEDMAVLESLVDDICRVDLTIQAIADGQPLDRALRIDPAARARVALERPPADEQPLLRAAA